MSGDATHDLLFGCDAEGLDIDVDVSIDIVDLLAILDEEPTQQPNTPVTTEGFQWGESDPRQSVPEQKYLADVENFREIGYSQWDVDGSGTQRVKGFPFHNESEQDPNGIIGRGGCHNSQIFHSNVNFPSTAQNSFDEPRSSHRNIDRPMAAFGGSSGSYLTVNFDPSQLQTMQGTTSGENTKGASLVPFPVASDNTFYLSCEKEVSEHQKHETRFQTQEDGSKPRGYLFGEMGSSHFFPIENFDSSGELQDNSSAHLDSTVENGNMCSSLYSYRNSASAMGDVVKPKTMCDGTGSCLSLLGDFPSDAGIPHIGSAPFQHDDNQQLSCWEYHHLPPQISRRTLNVNSHAEVNSPDTSLPDVSVTDLDDPLSDKSCTEYHSDDINLMSDSSTDSSPIPFKPTTFQVDRGAMNASQHFVPGSTLLSKSSFKEVNKDQLLQQKDGGSGVQRNRLRSIRNVEGDVDICVLDDISDPVRLSQAPVHEKMDSSSQFRGPCYPRSCGTGGRRLRPEDERLTLQLALQDLSQPKSEATPPDGVLAVPLLRHQKIALSWMVRKETNSLQRSGCCGGILADDQGLGKTVSTIALILMERSSPTNSTVVKKEGEYEALNLDDDDDSAEAIVMKQPCNSTPTRASMPVKKNNSVMVAKGRPAAGTLVVCPTSVLRQWAEELRTKVTSKASLSFIVYHGSNRTKDPHELAKYDVVLTTYAIVSMEVPKQPLVDKDDKDALSLSGGLIGGKKRKNPPISDLENQKGKGNMDGALPLSAARPLGRVGWFRVVLDEAQSIKNYRTQVARACWGLRAKRRWCLSGTPIQNAVDDLYSYFRFLRYDPYAAYKCFCSSIKIPISRNPTNGYKKLQAVLKTIMLRRTKGTILDGMPIINLPPKTISLKRVDFSIQERTFYSKLESESREQFMEYEDAGTVKQNYVNILLMLLRLRQACDHPLLVKSRNSNSNQRSSMEEAKKLPREKKIVLLTCLEVSLAICTVCNDPPEDAVVSICGHVFCNQCISDHLTADDNICPSLNCKVELHAASVFSRGTLKSVLSDELGDDCCSCSSCFDMGDEYKNAEDNWSSYSSKIKAALEILQSLPRCHLSSESIVKKSASRSFNTSFTTANSVLASSVDSSGTEHINLHKCSVTDVVEKAIVFSQWTRMLDLLEGPLKASCIQYRRLDGTMSIAARERAIEDFNTLPEVSVIIMSLKAASLGLNLVAANHVLLLDLWWNPTTEDQAIDRAHRIGQTRPVIVSRLTVKDTVEEKILSLQEKKREMVASAFGEDESGSRQSRLTVEDLRYIFMHDP